MKRVAKGIIFVLIIALFAGCSNQQPAIVTSAASIGSITSHPSASTKAFASENMPTAAASTPSMATTPLPTDAAGIISVHFIDVGKADSILIKSGSVAMLIDAGTPDMTNTVITYLKTQGIDKLDYVVATHSHDDHIGGLGAVLDAFPTAVLIMPDVPDNGEVYQSLLNSISARNLKWILPKAGNQYNLGEARFTILAPNGTGNKNLNDYSVVIRLVYGGTSFLFAGDALIKSEKEMLANKLPLASTLLKVAHHGSSAASSLGFLKAVKPEFAVISVDTSKKGYPSDKILQRLDSLGVKVYRTDEAGTIVAVSDGEKITFDKGPSLITPKPTKTPKVK
jgi:competence protein ComEC